MLQLPNKFYLFLIKYVESPQKVVISGDNKAALDRFAAIYVPLVAVACCAVWFIYNAPLTAWLALLFLLFLLFPIRITTRFKIELERQHIRIKKSFAGISYFLIEHDFQSVDYKESLFSFYGGEATLKIEYFTDFDEPDYLKIIINGTNCDIGNSYDQREIFNLVKKGVKNLALV